MDKKNFDVVSLLELLLNSQINQSDDELALYLLTHRSEIHDRSLKDLAKNSYFSQASFTRFFQKHGVDSFQQFKENLLNGDQDLQNYVNSFISFSTANTLEESRDYIVDGF